MNALTVYPSTKITRENLLSIHQTIYPFDGILFGNDFLFAGGAVGENATIYITPGKAMIQGRLVELSEQSEVSIAPTDEVMESGAYIKIVLETNGLEDEAYITYGADPAQSVPDEGHYEIEICWVYGQDTVTGFQLTGSVDRRLLLNAPHTDISEYLIGNKDYENECYASYRIINGVMFLSLNTIVRAIQEGDGERKICEIPVNIAERECHTIYTTKGVCGVKIYPSYKTNFASVYLIADPTESHEIYGTIAFPVA